MKIKCTVPGKQYPVLDEYEPPCKVKPLTALRTAESLISFEKQKELDLDWEKNLLKSR